jgi:hypothetical protein
LVVNVSGSVSGFGSNGFIEIKHLDKNHPGVTNAVSQALCEAATVCLDRHHVSPKQFQVKCSGQLGNCTVQWSTSTQRARNAHAYELDATKDGAYAVGLLCLERWLELVAIAEAEAGSGSDWYVAPLGSVADFDGLPDLDAPGVHRLEVSGQDTGSTGHRTKQKQHQLAVGKSSIPGISAVVGFQRATVTLEHLSSQKGGTTE